MTLDELYDFFGKQGTVLQIFMRKLPSTKQFKVSSVQSNVNKTKSLHLKHV